MEKEKYLPIGTVLMLKGGKKRVMVTGFCVIPDSDKEKMYDYCGCLYPEGQIKTNQTLMFNHDQIERIDYLGLIDDEERNFKSKLEEVMKKINSKKKENTTTEILGE